MIYELQDNTLVKFRQRRFRQLINTLYGLDMIIEY